MARRGRGLQHTAALLLCLAAALLRHAAAVVLVLPPGLVNTECVLQKLTPGMVKQGDSLVPGSFDGRATFFVRHTDAEYSMPPLAQVSIKGPSGNLLWERVVGVDFREDALFRGEGFGDYTVCVRNSRADVPVSVDLSYFAPFDGAWDTLGARTAPGQEVPVYEAGAEAQDLAGALGLVNRLRADMHRLRSDQSFLQARQQRHAATLASSERRAVVWSAFEALVLVALSGAQWMLFRHAFRNY